MEARARSSERSSGASLRVRERMELELLLVGLIFGAGVGALVMGMSSLGNPAHGDSRGAEARRAPFAEPFRNRAVGGAIRLAPESGQG